MQRTIEGLFEVRDQTQDEVARCRHDEAAAISAAREAQGRGDPSAPTLRQQLLDAQRESVATPSPPRMREHAEQVQAAKREEEAPARATASLRQTSTVQATTTSGATQGGGDPADSNAPNLGAVERPCFASQTNSCKHGGGCRYQHAKTPQEEYFRLKKNVRKPMV